MSCRKVRYRNELDARVALALMPDKVKRREVRAYRCPDCKRWHLTSKPQPGSVTR